MSEFYSYKDAHKASLNYFDGDILATEVFLEKYALKDRTGKLLEDTPDKMHWRLANEFARIEKSKFKNPLTSEEIYEYFKHFKRIIPQGSPMYAIGNPYQYVSASNCFVIDNADSYGGICRADEELVQIAKRRGGVGIDLSCLRPIGSETTNSSKTSTGIIPFMHRFSNTSKEVGQDGRRAALMLTLSVFHPEIVDFISSKTNVKDITGANISVKLYDEFLNAVKNKEKYEVKWPTESDNPKHKQVMDAEYVWDLIVSHARNNGEPGILFWDNIISNSPADCYPEHGFTTISTNPCSELPLPAYDSCRLISLNLYTYVIDPFTSNARFDYDKFKKDAIIAQRMADNLIDLENELVNRIIEKIEHDKESDDAKYRELSLWKKVNEKLLKGRRTGTGTTALGDTLAALGIKYGSKKSIEETEKIFKTLKLACYRSSVDMAKELGHFPIWNHENEKHCDFLLRIKEQAPRLYSDMKKHGRRNIGLLTGAPTGSVSLMTQTSSGMEPVFKLAYGRRRRIQPHETSVEVTFIDDLGDKWHDYKIFHPKFKEWEKITGKTDPEKSPWHGCFPDDLNWQSRVELQSVITKHLDHSISSTVNLPEDVTVEDVKKIYETAWLKGCKGITVYRKNSRSNVLVDLSNKRKEVAGTLLVKTSAPKRPKELHGDVFHIVVKGSHHTVVVGCLDKDPYEIFSSEKMTIPKNISSGIVRKIKRGHYELVCNDQSWNIAQAVATEESITRLISTALRHGSDIGFIVHQLEKAKGDFSSFEKSIARVLKKYIADGKSVHGESCESCGSDENLIREDGCVRCSCGWSRCC